MEILSTVIVGATVGGLAAWVFRAVSCCFSTSIAVGILGGLLGLASDFWLATGELTKLAFSEHIASGVGAMIALLLWFVAQRLFFGDPRGQAIQE